MIAPSCTSEELLFTTARIEGNCADGTVNLGTGFFYRFDVQVEGKAGELVALVTNKHVLEGVTQLNLRLHEADVAVKPAKPNGQFIDFQLPIEYLTVIDHPHVDCDLCAIPVEPLYRLAEPVNEV